MQGAHPCVFDPIRNPMRENIHFFVEGHGVIILSFS